VIWSRGSCAASLLPWELPVSAGGRFRFGAIGPAPSGRRLLNFFRSTTETWGLYVLDVSDTGRSPLSLSVAAIHLISPVGDSVCSGAPHETAELGVRSHNTATVRSPRGHSIYCRPARIQSSHAPLRQS